MRKQLFKFGNKKQALMLLSALSATQTRNPINSTHVTGIRGNSVSLTSKENIVFMMQAAP